ncbi:hypothetical protein SEA_DUMPSTERDUDE_71 [Gordonia phage DumpsterDude]|uniref:Uncharacterized protein n=1 Tax=Gordonia phage DumpsterDude TaxID=2713262 RepID=A0A6G8R0C7_9CAUD|nr:hypothetical protein JZX77_gp71 [Gordonia phage DumpsterDude]QIN93659.1 hypothetical protein SEA_DUMPSTERDUDE_71 [Gordonia phage DumpsterDude]
MNPLFGQQITRDHPLYRQATQLIMSRPDLRIPARPHIPRVRDEQAWLHGRELVCRVLAIGPNGDVIRIGDDFLDEPDLLRIPID